MAEQSTGPDNDNNTAGELRGQLAKRLAVAGVLVAMLLGVLAFFDYLASPPEDSESVVFTRPVPVAPQKAVSQPVTPTENLPEPPAPEKTEAAAEAPPPPKVEAQPVAPVEAQPPTPVESKPEARADQRPSAPASGPKPATAHHPAAAAPASPKPIPEGSAEPSGLSPRTTVPVEPAPPRPAARLAEPRPAAPILPPTVSRLFSGFVLQAGVFSSAQRAEELHAKLTLSGVPSTLETRVQVGPFRTKHEAEAAQAKLKELGIETIMVPPRGKTP